MACGGAWSTNAQNVQACDLCRTSIAYHCIFIVSCRLESVQSLIRLSNGEAGEPWSVGTRPPKSSNGRQEARTVSVI